MLCSRQSGKSTTAAIMSIGQAVTAPGSLTLQLAAINGTFQNRDSASLAMHRKFWPSPLPG
jgi:hypothetical protein